MAEEDRPADGDRLLWSLNRDEQRLLWITFVRGLASILVGAAVIGGAIAVARYEVRVSSLLSLAGSTGFVLLLVVIGSSPDHQLCCAHALRELQAVTDSAPAGQWCWAAQAADALTRMQALASEAIAQGRDTADPAALAAQVHSYRSAAS
jgi:hypothetical protein